MMDGNGQRSWDEDALHYENNTMGAPDLFGFCLNCSYHNPSGLILLTQ